jgi:hypothetical protein
MVIAASILGQKNKLCKKGKSTNKKLETGTGVLS